MNSRTFFEDFNALSQLLQSSEDAFAQRVESKPHSNVDVVKPDSQTTRASLQEKIERESFDQSDGKSIPKCEILYQQPVETTDAFLGLSEKTPSSVSCEMLLIKIYLPKLESLAELELTCKENRILLSSRDYKLFKYLPHEVHQDKGKAQWNRATKLLIIELPKKNKELF